METISSSFIIFTFVFGWRVAAVALLVEALRYKSAGRGFDSFFIWIFSLT
jgi:hypothetical protein